MNWLKEYAGAAINAAIAFGLMAIAIWAPGHWIDVHRPTMLLAGLGLLGVGAAAGNIERKQKRMAENLQTNTAVTIAAAANAETAAEKADVAAVKADVAAVAAQKAREQEEHRG
jgi:uncharacterized membrane protein